MIKKVKAIFACQLVHLLEAPWKSADVLKSLLDELLTQYLEHILVEVFKTKSSRLLRCASSQSEFAFRRGVDIVRVRLGC